jgi:ATP adenylyltransferase
MDRLWAPWRLPYILKAVRRRGRAKGGGCIFCRALEKNRRGRATQLIEESRHSFSLLNLFPYNNGHLMIAPKRHVSGLARLRSEELADLVLLLEASRKRLKRILRPHGFNIGLNLGRAAGAGLTSHLHFHIVPRWNGDTNFMPLFAGTKVISESLDACRRRLLDDIQKRARKTRK